MKTVMMFKVLMQDGIKKKSSDIELMQTCSWAIAKEELKQINKGRLRDYAYIRFMPVKS